MLLKHYKTITLIYPNDAVRTHSDNIMKYNTEKYVQCAEHYVSDLLIHRFPFNTIFHLISISSFFLLAIFFFPFVSD